MRVGSQPASFGLTAASQVSHGSSGGKCLMDHRKPRGKAELRKGSCLHSTGLFTFVELISFSLELFLWSWWGFTGTTDL